MLYVRPEGVGDASNVDYDIPVGPFLNLPRQVLATRGELNTKIKCSMVHHLPAPRLSPKTITTIQPNTSTLIITPLRSRHLLSSRSNIPAACRPTSAFTYRINFSKFQSRQQWFVLRLPLLQNRSPRRWRSRRRRRRPEVVFDCMSNWGCLAKKGKKAGAKKGAKKASPKKAWACRLTKWCVPMLYQPIPLNTSVIAARLTRGRL